MSDNQFTKTEESNLFRMCLHSDDNPVLDFLPEDRDWKFAKEVILPKLKMDNRISILDLIGVEIIKEKQPEKYARLLKESLLYSAENDALKGSLSYYDDGRRRRSFDRLVYLVDAFWAVPKADKKLIFDDITKIERFIKTLIFNQTKQAILSAGELPYSCQSALRRMEEATKVEIPDDDYFEKPHIGNAFPWIYLKYWAADDLDFIPRQISSILDFCSDEDKEFLVSTFEHLRTSLASALELEVEKNRQCTLQTADSLWDDLKIESDEYRRRVLDSLYEMEHRNPSSVLDTDALLAARAHIRECTNVAFKSYERKYGSLPELNDHGYNDDYYYEMCQLYDYLFICPALIALDREDEVEEVRGNIIGVLSYFEEEDEE